MPIPGPINSHRRRSEAVAAARRGYHANGTDSTRPSRSSTTSVSRVTFALTAMGSAATPEVLMPCLLDVGLVLAHERGHPGQFSRREPVVVLEPHGSHPELRGLPIPCDVHMNRLPTITGEEEQAVRTALQDRRAHSAIVAALPVPRISCRLTYCRSAASGALDGAQCRVLRPPLVGCSGWLDSPAYDAGSRHKVRVRRSYSERRHKRGIQLRGVPFDATNTGCPPDKSAVQSIPTSAQSRCNSMTVRFQNSSESSTA